MASKGFSLSEFFPEPLTFTDDGFEGDGKTHEVKTVELLGAVDSVRLQRLYTQLLKSQGSGDEKLAVTLEHSVDDMMVLLIPTLPRERVNKISFQAKFGFLKWWKSEQANINLDNTIVPGEVEATAKPGKRKRGKVASKAAKEASELLTLV